MIKAITFLLLAASCFICSINCKIGIFRLENATTATLKCMVSQGIANLMYLTLSPPPQTINQDLYSIKNAGMGTDIYFLIFPDSDKSPLQYVKLFIDFVRPLLIDRVWIVPFYFPTGQLYWQSNIKLINQYIKLFIQNVFQAGIASNRKNWKNLTNNTEYFNSIPLCWFPQIQNGIPSFDDYQPFGGWQKPAIKFFTNKTICGIQGKSLYYEP